MTDDLQRLQAALGRVLAADERNLIAELEEAGLAHLSPPPEEPQRTPIELLQAEPDCEEFTVQPKGAGNPDGHVLARVYRSRARGQEFVVRYQFEQIMRAGKCVGWRGTGEVVTVRKPSGGDGVALTKELGVAQVRGTVDAAEVALSPTEAEAEAYRRQWADFEAQQAERESLLASMHSGGEA